MSTSIVGSIVVACDAASDIQAAVEQTARLAAQLRAMLHGVFLQDENLSRLAALPFARQTTLSLEANRSLSSADVERFSASLGTAMQRSLAEAATRHRIAWSFDSMHGVPSLQALEKFKADLLVVQGQARVFSGSWAPRLLWSSLPASPSRPLLIQRRRSEGPHTALIILGSRDLPDPQSALLATGLAVAAAEDEVVIYLQDGSDSDAAALQQAASQAGARAGSVRVQLAPARGIDLEAAIARLNPALVVLDSAQSGSDAVKQTIAFGKRDVLLVPKRGVTQPEDD